MAPLILGGARHTRRMLAVTAFVLVTVLGIGLGVVAAVRQNGPLDHARLDVSPILGISVPEFFWGIVLILVFSRCLGWLPAGGIGDATDRACRRSRRIWSCPPSR